jgi:hypothetical protein
MFVFLRFCVKSGQSYVKNIERTKLFINNNRYDLKANRLIIKLLNKRQRQYRQQGALSAFLQNKRRKSTLI